MYFFQIVNDCISKIRSVNTLFFVRERPPCHAES
jgi:hypothetical protein